MFMNLATRCWPNPRIPGLLQAHCFLRKVNRYNYWSKLNANISDTLNVHG